jgi:2'-5' RNA ligase
VAAAEAFHITLKFIGDVQETTAADLDEELRGDPGPALDLELQGVGHFGEGVEIHAVWAGVAEKPATCAAWPRPTRAPRGGPSSSPRPASTPRTSPWPI